MLICVENDKTYPRFASRRNKSYNKRGYINRPKRNKVATAKYGVNTLASNCVEVLQSDIYFKATL